MNITLLQTELYWHDPVANRAMLEERIFNLAEPTDLIVLPEMFTTGFTMEAQAVAEPMNLTTFRWMKQMAAQTGAVVTGSYVIQEKRGYFNRLIWMQPDGQFDTYDKRHLFRMAGEDKVYTAGTRRIIKEWKGWRICPLVCYDLRFPVWSRNRQADSTDFEYDLLLYVANWPSVRRNPWNILLQARAIENLSYVAGVNRVGTDHTGHLYSGDSAVIDFKGDVLFRHSDTEMVHQQTLSLDELRAFRTKFPANLDADSFTID
ncbi:amidohydrolase [Spirosoma sp. KCTC 42546]|uniref:amidohydrolase n=1 Tax=Spirosoma sp. KCTC 42546 TaxID=2520506 RepID=UPI0011599570|nr:amidohydrolase [Spirosoma sp. KCTC 42546]QDK83549.1 amidohydrolase [Spirosoma sp. KCTC 42546]